MPGRLLRGLLAVVLLCGASACQRDPGTPAEGWASPSPSPQPSGYTSEILNNRARTATLTDRDFSTILGPGALTTQDGWGGLQPCPVDLVSDQWVLSGYVNQWTSTSSDPTDKDLRVEQYTVGFLRGRHVLRAAEVIAEIRARATCDTYLSREGTPKMLGPWTIPAPAGVDDSYAFCERIQPGARGSCTFYLAVNEILSKVRVLAVSENVAKEVALSLLAPAAAHMAPLR